MKLTIPLLDGTCLTFEGTHDELLQTAETFAQKHGTMVAIAGKTPEHEHQPMQKSGASRRWTDQTVKKLWGLLYGEQAKLVRFLVGRGGKATYAELGKHMGYDAQKLSGILSAITRNSQTGTGDRLARLVDWRVRDNGVREYYVEGEVLPFLQQVIGHGSEN